MIGYFKEARRERRELIKAVNLLAERLEDLGEYRKDLPEVLLEAAEELGSTLSVVSETLRRIEQLLGPGVSANEALARYFKYEIELQKKANEDLGKAPGRHDDMF